MDATSQKPIYARYHGIRRVSVTDIRQMYEVFCQYYEHTDVETFLADLSKKSGVILVKTRDEKRVVGFSTVVNMKMELDGVRGRGIFSGDTIMDKAYWGSRTLQMAFFRYVVREKLRAPLSPVFWLLISKGYKTYLLLANNFERYYPHPDKQHSELDSLVRSYCDELFPGHFDPARGVLDFGATAQRLREDVAGISEEMRSRYPKIRFFEKQNPTWHEGTELPCVGVVDSKMLASFALKAMRGPTRTARAPTVRVDSIGAGSARMDSARMDSVRADSVRVDSSRAESAGVGSTA